MLFILGHLWLRLRTPAAVRADMSAVLLAEIDRQAARFAV